MLLCFYSIRVKLLLPRNKLVLIYHSLITSLLMYTAPLFGRLPTCKLWTYTRITGKIPYSSLFSSTKKALSFLMNREQCEDQPLHVLVLGQLLRHHFFEFLCQALHVDFILSFPALVYLPIQKTSEDKSRNRWRKLSARIHTYLINNNFPILYFYSLWFLYNNDAHLIKCSWWKCYYIVSCTF